MFYYNKFRKCNLVYNLPISYELGGEEQGFQPSTQELLEIDRQHSLDCPLPLPIPEEVKLACDNWCQDHCVAINVTNVRQVYVDLRRYLTSHI